MSNNNLASVIVAAYNAEMYIEETIQSIFKQTYPFIEIILVNDGSTDNTESVLEKFLHLENFKYIRIENSGGPSKPRNLGINAASGNFIFIFDADDLMYPMKIEETIRFFNLAANQNIGIFITNFIRIDKASNQIGRIFLEKYEAFMNADKQCIGAHYYKVEKETAWDILFQDNYIGTSSVMLPKNIVEKGFRFDEEMKNADDRDLWLRLTHEYNLGFIDIALHGYRIHGEGLFGTASSQRIIQRAQVLEKHLQHIRSKKKKQHASMKIAKIYYSAGYYHQNKGEYQEAIKIYTKAFLKYRKLLLLRGAMVSFVKFFKREW